MHEECFKSARPSVQGDAEIFELHTVQLHSGAGIETQSQSRNHHQHIERHISMLCIIKGS